MSETVIQNLLVVGIDTVSITDSAKKAGYKIYAADYFGDTDLQRTCLDCEAITEQKPGKSCGKFRSKFKPEAFLEITKSMLQKHKIDAILLSSGLDDFSDILSELDDMVPILGNPPEIIEKTRTKTQFFKELESLGIRHPETAIAKNIEEAKAAATEISYPVVIKPEKGFGGAGIRTSINSREIERAFAQASLVSRNVIVQKFIDGIPASVSFLAADQKAKILTLNRQLLGTEFLCQQEPFGYCGNIVPLHLSGSVYEKCASSTDKIVSQFGLVGSNGIDLVVSREGVPYVVEINPRFQGTLECVERVLGINLVKLHIEACLDGFLPTLRKKISNFCTRLILYAPKRVIAPDLTSLQGIRNVPVPETIIEKGEPLCSVIAEGENSESSFQKGKRLARLIYGLLAQPSLQN